MSNKCHNICPAKKMSLKIFNFFDMTVSKIWGVCGYHQDMWNRTCQTILMSKCFVN